MVTPAEVIRFWIDEVGEDGWFAVVPAVDQQIRDRFLPAWEEARAGRLTEWCETAEGALAFLILTDQFPRNMFRGDPRAFATDEAARNAARQAIARGFDLTVDQPRRTFFYLPFEHSEDMADQHWSVALMEVRTPGDEADDYPVHARTHREIIRRFGRFPFRNAALGRVSTAEEEAFLAAGGYGALVKEMAG